MLRVHETCTDDILLPVVSNIEIKSGTVNHNLLTKTTNNWIFKGLSTKKIYCHDTTLIKLMSPKDVKLRSHDHE